MFAVRHLHRFLTCSRHVRLVGNLGSEGYALMTPRPGLSKGWAVVPAFCLNFSAKTLQLNGTLWACLNMFFGSTSALIFISLARLSPQ
jgi:hypothetical protein